MGARKGTAPATTLLHVRDAVEPIVHHAGPTLDDLAALIRPPAWHADAACREHPEVSWFPERGEPTTAAKAICAGCLVKEECAAYALEHEDALDGIWASTSPRERRAMRRAA